MKHPQIPSSISDQFGRLARTKTRTHLIVMGFIESYAEDSRYEVRYAVDCDDNCYTTGPVKRTIPFHEPDMVACARLPLEVEFKGFYQMENPKAHEFKTEDVPWNEIYKVSYMLNIKLRIKMQNIDMTSREYIEAQRTVKALGSLLDTTKHHYVAAEESDHAPS